VPGYPHDSAAIVGHDRHPIALVSVYFSVNEHILQLLPPSETQGSNPVPGFTTSHDQARGEETPGLDLDATD
jgi:hypothetical protein